jgi:hypothetical protein
LSRARAFWVGNGSTIGTKGAHIGFCKEIVRSKIINKTFPSRSMVGEEEFSNMPLIIYIYI